MPPLDQEARAHGIENETNTPWHSLAAGTRGPHLRARLLKWTPSTVGSDDIGALPSTRIGALKPGSCRGPGTKKRFSARRPVLASRPSVLRPFTRRISVEPPAVTWQCDVTGPSRHLVCWSYRPSRGVLAVSKVFRGISESNPTTPRQLGTFQWFLWFAWEAKRAPGRSRHREVDTP